MRCVIYRRVSTDMQAEQGFSLDAQEQRLRAYAESQGWTIVEDYCDDGYSAKNTDRPRMQQMIEDMKEKKFDVVLVYKLDRFVRSVSDLHNLLQIMDKYDVKFKSATEVFDTTSATGRLFITLIATLAQWERETIAERVHMAMLKKVELGERNGAPAPYGYDKGLEGTLTINDDEAKWVKYIFNRYLKVGATTIAKELNKKGVKTKKGEVWSDFAIRYLISNPIYAGYVRWNYESTSTGIRKKTNEEIITPVSQEDFVPIITKDEFEEIQRINKSRSNTAFRSDNFYPYSGIVKCDKCGYSMTGSTKKMNSGKIHRYYKCRGKFNFGICDSQVIAESALDEALLSTLTLMKDNINISGSEEIDLAEIQSQLKQISKKKERAEDLYISGDISKNRYIKKIEELKQEEEQLQQIVDSAGMMISKDKIIQTLTNIKDEWHDFTFESRKTAIHHLFKSIRVRIDRKADPGKNIKAIVSIVDYEFL